MVHHRVGLLDPVFVFLSWIGSWGLVWLVLALVLAVLWRRPTVFLQVAIADALAGALSYALRVSIDRDRPPLDYPRPEPLVHLPGSGSIPSGHATAAFACATVLAFWAPRFAVPLFLLAAAIAFSRVYVGVHYPLDVLAGAALGVAIAIALRWLSTSRRRSPRSLPAR
ncbi:MAG: phosphatase PAP2 family protein [Actinomycetota bacterium]|nr:phosphatase PAP2 family protein [Actinomycetota bacterium]